MGWPESFTNGLPPAEPTRVASSCGGPWSLRGVSRIERRISACLDDRLMTIILGAGWFLIGLTVFILAAYVVIWVLYVPIAARVFGESPWLPAKRHEPLDEGQTVELHTQDGCRLEGTYLPTAAAERQGVIAFFHEFNGERWSAIPYTADLRRRGFDVFTFDFRCHGSSDCIAGYKPMPWVTNYDVADARAVIDYLCSRSDADSSRHRPVRREQGGHGRAVCGLRRSPRAIAGDRRRRSDRADADPLRAPLHEDLSRAIRPCSRGCPTSRFARRTPGPASWSSGAATAGSSTSTRRLEGCGSQ